MIFSAETSMTRKTTCISLNNIGQFLMRDFPIPRNSYMVPSILAAVSEGLIWKQNLDLQTDLVFYRLKKKFNFNFFLCFPCRKLILYQHRD